MPRQIDPFAGRDGRKIWSVHPLSTLQQDQFKKLLDEFTLNTLRDIVSKNLLHLYVRRAVGLGDVLMSGLIVRALERKLPRAFKVHFLTSKQFVGVIRRAKIVQSVAVDRMKPHKFVIDLQGKVDFGKFCTTGHRLDLLGQLVGLSPNEIDTKFRVRMDSKWVRRGRELVGSVRNRVKIGVAPFAFAEIRSWPNWLEFLDLIEKHQYGAVFLHDKQVEVPQRLGLINLSGALGVTDLCAVLRSCDVVVSVDTGIVHACGFLGVPFVGLYGPIDPVCRLKYYENYEVVYHKDSCPQCPCWDWQFGCCNQSVDYMRCMKSITPVEVMERVEVLLSRLGTKASGALT